MLDHGVNLPVVRKTSEHFDAAGCDGLGNYP